MDVLDQTCAQVVSLVEIQILGSLVTRKIDRVKSQIVNEIYDKKNQDDLDK